MSASWTCTRCRVTVTFQSRDAEPDIPNGWADGKDGLVCLGCRRSAVSEEAAGSSETGRGARRRRALTEFEILRDPEASDQVIAKRVRCNTASVAPVRRAMRESGALS
jgi:hypothetical protein